MTILSVLDQSPIRRGGTAEQALRETVQLAQAAEQLGYHRYWLAEHHASGGLASATPEILIAHVAAQTLRIRVGSGGVMLGHYSALKVAESFRMLEALYPGRIDLGIGRAPGSDSRTARALSHDGRGLDPERFPAQVADLYGWVSGRLPPGHPFADIRASPDVESVPELWLLGSTTESASYAAHFGWRFSFAHFITPEGGEAIVPTYRRHFRPSPLLGQAVASLGVSVTCAETNAAAERLSWSRWCWRILSNRGQRGGIPSPEEAMAFPYTPPERAYLDYMRRNSIHGDPATCRARLLALGQQYEVDEFVVLTITHDFAARIRSYELLAKAFAADMSAGEAASA